MIERVGAHSLRELRAAYNATYSCAEYGEKDALHAQALRLLEASPGEAVLDVGCGGGHFLSFAAARGLRPVGLDLADGALARARARGIARLVLGQGERLPFPDAAFARVACLGNLEHFLDPAAGARELRRVLTPRGRAAVLLPNAWYSGDLWRRLLGGRGPDHHQVIDRFASHREWRRLLEGAGLVVLRVERWDKGKPWKRIFPFPFAYHFLFQVAREPAGPLV